MTENIHIEIFQQFPYPVLIGEEVRDPVLGASYETESVFVDALAVLI